MSDATSKAREMVKTSDVMVALRERYCQPEFAFFEEVGDAGSRSRVYADGVAINMWASRSYALSGFEVKVSRSDWLRELKQPNKAEPIIIRCDHFYLVAPDDVYLPDEVPPSWGILSYKDGALREKRKAPLLEAKPITREFVAQMFRRAHVNETADIKKHVDKALADERASIQRRIDDAVKYKLRELQRDADKWTEVEKAVGKTWMESAEVVLAVKAVLAAGVTGTWSNMQLLVDNLRHASERVSKAVEPFQAGRRESRVTSALPDATTPAELDA